MLRVVGGFWLQMVRFIRDNPKLVITLEVAIIFSVFWLTCWRTVDADFGWHLQAGNYIRAHGIPSHDVFSYTASNFRWIDHEWLSDVLISFCFQHVGYLGLSLILAGLWTTALFLYGRQYAAVILFGAVSLVPYVSIRPTVWTVLLLGVLLRLITSKKLQPRLLYLIPILFVVWANLHGGFSAGLAVLVFYAVKNRSTKWLLIVLLSTLATFINPYGPRLYIEVFRTLTDPAVHSQIAEWRSLALEQKTWPFIVLWSTGFILYYNHKLKSLLALTPLMLLASLSATRNFPLFVMAGLYDLHTYRQQFVPLKNLDRQRQIIVALFTLFVFGVLGSYLYHIYTPFRGHSETGYPRQAVAYLETHGCSGRLFNNYNFGGYLIWKVPSVPVYIDGRMPTWNYPSGGTYMDHYYDVLEKPAVQKAEFARYNIRCALIPDGQISKQIRTTLQKAGWQDVVHADYSQLLIAPSTAK